MKLYLTMPQPGETITQGTLVKWLVKPGAAIKEKDPIAELETEKAVFEYESPFEGKLTEILAKPQQTVPVGEPIAIFEVDPEKGTHYVMLGVGKEVGKEEKKETKKETKVGAQLIAPLPKGESQRVSVKLSPLVRSLLREHDLDDLAAAKIEGTGPGARITKEDILGYLETKSAPSPGLGSATLRPPSPSRGEGRGEGDKIIPCSPVRLRIAENMVLSKQTIPHAHTSVTVDVTPLVEYRARLTPRPSYMSLIFPALKKAIGEFPMVNASFRDEGNEKSIVLHKRINLGIAVDTPRGLYIVVVPDADKKTDKEFENELEAVLKRAQDNKLKPQDLTSMTFTFNNYGYYGTHIGVQVILPPQSTTLGMGKIEKRPWVVSDGIQIRWLSELTMAFDHRVMDGRDAGLFLNSIKKSLENFSMTR